MAKLLKNEVRCDGCGKEISDSARNCPFCGHKMLDSPIETIIKALFAMLILALSVWVIWLALFS
jgi:DNA-directed RNA polymerase subunit RPC12/RpoP